MTLYVLLTFTALLAGMAISVKAFGTGGKRKRMFREIYFSIEDVEGIGILYTKTGEYSAILRIENPVQKFSADIDSYYEYTRLFTALAQTLGEGYALHKQDIFTRQGFEEIGNGRHEFLSESYFRYFKGRQYTNSRTYLTVTQENRKGNLSSLRDWGYAKDYVECMWLILQNDKPEDFVIATGEQHSVREFCQLAFHHVGIELRFEGEGENEKGIDTKTGKVLVEVSPDFYRPTDVVNLWGDPLKAKRELGWNPQKTSFEQLVKLMVDADMEKVAVERAGERVRTNLAEYLEKGIVK